MFPSVQIGLITCYVDELNISLANTNGDGYVLALSAITDGEIMAERSIVINASNLPAAMAEVVEHVNGQLTYDIAPGITLLQPEKVKLTLGDKVVLTPHQDPTEVVRGIYIGKDATQSGCEVGNDLAQQLADALEAFAQKINYV